MFIGEEFVKSRRSWSLTWDMVDALHDRWWWKICLANYAGKSNKLLGPVVSEWKVNYPRRYTRLRRKCTDGSRVLYFWICLLFIPRPTGKVVNLGMKSQVTSCNRKTSPPSETTKKKNTRRNSTWVSYCILRHSKRITHSIVHVTANNSWLL